MPINRRELMNAISVLANSKNVRVTIKNSGEGAMVCAACSFVGGILLGRSGMVIGGAVGGMLAYGMTEGTFRSLGDVILNDLNDSQKEQLAQHVKKAVQDVHPTDLVMLLPLIKNNVAVQQTVLKAVLKFVSNELQLQVID